METIDESHVSVVEPDDDRWRNRTDTVPTEYDDPELFDRTVADREVVVGLDRRGILAVAGVVDRGFLTWLAECTTLALERVDLRRRVQRRADDEARLRRERDVADHVAALYSNVWTALARAKTRDQVERTACEQIATLERYSFAWIAERDHNSRSLRVRTRAGIGAGFADRVSIAPGGSTGRSLTSDVLDDTEMVVVDAATDPMLGDLGVAADERGFRTIAFVPIRHDGSTFGLLGVCADSSGAFDHPIRDALDDVGRAIGYAIHVENHRRALLSDAVVELEFDLADDDILAVRLSEDLGCHVELRGMLVESDGSLLAFLAVDHPDVEPVVDRVDAYTDVVEAAVARSDDDGIVLQLRVDSPIATYLADKGAVLRSVTASDGQGRAVVELPRARDVRAFIDRVTADYPDADLVARRDRSRSNQSPAELRRAIESSLTDRQHEVLQVAFHAGYFDWPRENDGADIADMLDVAQPTFLQHLRTAERKLLTSFFERELSIYSAE